MPQQKTEGNAPAAASNEVVIPEETELTDAKLLSYIAGQVEDLIELVRDRCDGLEKRLAHLDGFAHEIAQKVDAIHADLEKYRPLLEKYSALQGFFKPKGQRHG